MADSIATPGGLSTMEQNQSGIGFNTVLPPDVIARTPEINIIANSGDRIPGEFRGHNT